MFGWAPFEVISLIVQQCLLQGAAEANHHNHHLVRLLLSLAHINRRMRWFVLASLDAQQPLWKQVVGGSSSSSSSSGGGGRAEGGHSCASVDWRLAARWKWAQLKLSKVSFSSISTQTHDIQSILLLQQGASVWGVQSTTHHLILNHSVNPGASDNGYGLFALKLREGVQRNHDSCCWEMVWSTRSSCASSSSSSVITTTTTTTTTTSSSTEFQLPTAAICCNSLFVFSSSNSNSNSNNFVHVNDLCSGVHYTSVMTDSSSSSAICSMACTDTLLVAGCADGSLLLWDIIIVNSNPSSTSPQLLPRQHQFISQFEGSILAIILSHNLLVVAGRAKVIYIYSASTFALLYAVFVGDYIYCMSPNAPSSSDLFLVCGSFSPKTACGALVTVNASKGILISRTAVVKHSAFISGITVAPLSNKEDEEVEEGDQIQTTSGRILTCDLNGIVCIWNETGSKIIRAVSMSHPSNNNDKTIGFMCTGITVVITPNSSSSPSSSSSIHILISRLQGLALLTLGPLCSTVTNGLVLYEMAQPISPSLPSTTTTLPLITRMQQYMMDASYSLNWRRIF